MKADIHPKYYTNARVICSCGNSWITGSTLPEIRTDVCSACHPYFTGEQRIVDTAGQVERFMKRLERRQSESARREFEMQVRKEADDAARKARAARRRCRRCGRGSVRQVRHADPGVTPVLIGMKGRRAISALFYCCPSSSSVALTHDS